MDSYEAYSSYKENTKVHCYEFLKEESNDLIVFLLRICNICLMMIMMM